MMAARREYRRRRFSKGADGAVYEKVWHSGGGFHLSGYLDEGLDVGVGVFWRAKPLSEFFLDDVDFFVKVGGVLMFIGVLFSFTMRMFRFRSATALGPSLRAIS